jgi:glycosyltransferase involved in cell wall biosynthesis
MKVLIITSKGCAHGGAEQVIAETNAMLAAKGITMRTLSSDLGSGNPFHDWTFHGLHAFSFIAGTPLSSSRWQYVLYPFKLFFFLWNFSSFFRLRSILREYDPDVVHLHTMIQVSPSVLFLLKNYPTVMTLHGPETFLRHLLLWCLTPMDFKQASAHELYPTYHLHDLNLMGWLTYIFFRWIQKPIYTRGLRSVDLFVAPSHFMQRTAEIDVSPILHVPSFTELQPFSEIGHPFQLLFVGRLVNVKGVEYLIRALPLIHETFPHARLTIVGDGAGRSALLLLAQMLGVDDSIYFAGWVEHDNVSRYYQACGMVIVPSIWPDNFPTVCNEAMSAGRPVIGSNVGGIPELIDDGINGYLVQPARPDQIAQKVIMLFSDIDLLRVMGKHARQKAEHTHSKERYGEQMEAIYRKVVSNA